VNIAAYRTAAEHLLFALLVLLLMIAVSVIVVPNLVLLICVHVSILIFFPHVKQALILQYLITIELLKYIMNILVKHFYCLLHDNELYLLLTILKSGNVRALLRLDICMSQLSCLRFSLTVHINLFVYCVHMSSSFSSLAHSFPCRSRHLSVLPFSSPIVSLAAGFLFECDCTHEVFVY